MSASHDDKAHLDSLPKLADRRARQWPVLHTNTALARRRNRTGVATTGLRTSRQPYEPSAPPLRAMPPAAQDVGWVGAGWTRSVAAHLVCRDGPRYRWKTATEMRALLRASCIRAPVVGSWAHATSSSSAAADRSHAVLDDDDDCTAAGEGAWVGREAGGAR